MGTRLNPGRFDCHAAAADDEPTFVLLARDRHAPILVALWAALRDLDAEDPDKVAEARQCAAAMQAWADGKGRSPLPMLDGSPVALAAALAERSQQLEDWTPEHDDDHFPGDLALAAACYCQTVSERVTGTSDATIGRDPPDLWPWEGRWWKPRNDRRDLVRAAALVLAEIERIDREAEREASIALGREDHPDAP